MGKRIFILALDALDARLVEKFRLENLLQTNWGTFSIAEFKETFGKIFTPTIWAAFICGEIRPIKHWYTYGKVFDAIRDTIPKFFRDKLSDILVVRGHALLKARATDRRDLKVKTIFDQIKPSVAVNIPAFNEDLKLRTMITQSLEKQGLSAFEEVIWRVHEKRVSETLSRLKEESEWKLFMAWFDLADWLGHLHIARRPHKFDNAYLNLERWARNLKELTKPCIFLVVSDHGMEPMLDDTGDHSLHGFYSINLKGELGPKRITDFYGKIIDWTKREKVA